MTITAVVIFLVFVYIIAGLVVFWWGTRTPLPGSKSLVRSAANRIASIGDRIGVSLYAGPKELPRPKRQTSKHFDVFLVIDHSASMGYGPGSPLQEAQKAAQSFVERIPKKSCRIGTIQFDSTAEKLSGLTSDKNSLREAIFQISPGGNTSMDAALEMALPFFEEAQGKRGGESSVQDLLIVLSDGLSNPKKAKEAAEALKEAGVHIMTIALGPDADVDLMGDIASTSENCFKTLDPEELTHLYEEIADSLEEIFGYHILIREKYNYGKVNLSGIGNVNPVRLDLPNGNINWFIPFLSREIAQIPYQIVPEYMGWYRIDLARAEMKAQDPQGNPHEFKSNQGPYILVLPKFGRKALFFVLNPIFWWLFGKYIQKRRQVLTLKPLPKPITYKPPPEPELIIPYGSEEVRHTVNPTLVVGLGYGGRWILAHLKKALLDMFDGNIPEHVGLLHIDVATLEHLKEVKFTGVTLEKHETFSLSSNLEPMLREIAASRGANLGLDWLPAKELLKTFQNLNLVDGAKGNRFLGRAALFKNFNKLLEVIEHKTDRGKQEGLDVLVVGSMSGGTSSGIILDVCAMIRSAVKKHNIPGVGINVVLLSPESFAGPAGAASESSKNGASLLRELDRIMVNRDSQIIFSYGSEEDQQLPVNNIVDRVFFTGCNLGEARQTLYPMVGEFLLTWMHSNAFRTYFQTMASREAEHIKQTAGSVSHGFGLSSVQFPIKDIKEVLINRTMLHLLGDRFLYVVKEGDHFSLISDEWVETKAKDALSNLFSDGYLNRSRPVYLTSMAGLSDTTMFIETVRKLDILLRGEKSEFFQEQLIKQDLEQLTSLFEEWCSCVLNGQVSLAASTPEIIATRRGKLAVITRALDMFIEQCDQISEYADAVVPEQLGKEGEQFSAESLKSIYQNYKRLAGMVRDEVSRWIWTLLDGSPSDKFFLTASRPGMPGLYRMTNDLYQDACENLKALKEIRTIRYIADDKILDQIYNDYYEPIRDDLISRFLWKVESDPSRQKVSIRLHLHTDKDYLFEPKSDNVETIYNRIRDLIVNTTRLSSEQSVENFEQETSNLLVRNCRLPVAVSGGTAAGVERRLHVCFWRPRGYPPALGDIQRQTHEVALDLGCGDPNRASLILTEALQAFGSTDSMERAIDRAGSWGELPYVFHEEQAAAKLERFLNREGIFAGRISARLVPYLREKETLQDFLMCLSQNKIRKKVYRMKECAALDWQGKTYWLTTEDQSIHGEPLLWPAMDQFILRKFDAYEQNTSLPISSFIKETSSAYQITSADLGKEEITQKLLDLDVHPDDKALEHLLIIYKAFLTSSMRR